MGTSSQHSAHLLQCAAALITFVNLPDLPIHPDRLSPQSGSDGQQAPKGQLPFSAWVPPCIVHGVQGRDVSELSGDTLQTSNVMSGWLMVSCMYIPALCVCHVISCMQADLVFELHNCNSLYRAAVHQVCKAGYIAYFACMHARINRPLWHSS